MNDAAQAQVQDANALALPQEFSFYFREDKLGNKRPTVKLNLEIPTILGIVQAAADPKIAELIVEAVQDVILSQAREQVNSNINISQETLDVSKLSLAAIANMPKATRRGAGISKEVWEEFGADYKAVMLKATGKEEDKIEKHVQILLNKFNNVKTNKPVVEFMRSQLAQWLTATQAADDYAACYEFLDNKAKALLEADETAMLENL